MMRIRNLNWIYLQEKKLTANKTIRLYQSTKDSIKDVSEKIAKSQLIDSINKSSVLETLQDLEKIADENIAKQKQVLFNPELIKEKEDLHKLERDLDILEIKIEKTIKDFNADVDLKSLISSKDDFQEEIKKTLKNQFHMINKSIISNKQKLHQIAIMKNSIIIFMNLKDKCIIINKKWNSSQC